MDDVVGLHQHEPVVDLDGHLVAAACWPAISLDQPVELAAPAGSVRRRRRAAGPLDGRLQPARVDRLQQVVDGVHLEGLDGALVEGGDEDRRSARFPASSSRRATSKPVSPGICTSRNDHVGREPRRSASSASTPLAGLADHLDAADLPEQEAQLLPRQLLVVDDDGRERAVGHAVMAGELARATDAASSGISTRAQRALAGRRRSAPGWQSAP